MKIMRLQYSILQNHMPLHRQGSASATEYRVYLAIMQKSRCCNGSYYWYMPWLMHL